MTEKEKLKMQRKEAEKSLSKKSREKNLKKNTYRRNKEESNNFLEKQSEQELEEMMWQQYLNNEYGQNNNSNSNLSGWNHQNNGPMSPPYRPRWVQTINGNSIMLSEREANAYNDGLFNEISAPFQHRGRRSYLLNSNNSTYSPMSPNSINSEIFNNSDITRSLKNSTKVFSNEESNSGYLSNSQFLSSRHKRTGKTKSKRSILNLKHLE